MEIGAPCLLLPNFWPRLNTFGFAVSALSVSATPRPKLARGGLVDTSAAACCPSAGCVSAVGGECCGSCLAREGVSRKHHAACQSRFCRESRGPAGLVLHEHASEA